MLGPQRKIGDWAVSLAVLLAAILAMYGYYLLHPNWPFRLVLGDFRRYYAPVAFYFDTMLHQGEFPLWNPLSFCGTPFAANPQSTVFYPPYLIRGLLNIHPTPFSTHVSLGLLMMFHMAVGGLGMVALARGHGLSRGAQFVAAFAYIFSPCFVRLGLDGWVIAAAACWFPWILFLFHRVLNATSMRLKVFWAICTGLIFGLCLLSGFPQITFYVALSLGAYWLFHSLRLRPDSLETSTITDDSDVLSHTSHTKVNVPWALKSGFRNGLILSLVFVLGALTASALLFPAAEFVPQGDRHKASGHVIKLRQSTFSFQQELDNLAVFTGTDTLQRGIRAAGLASIFLVLCTFSHRRKREIFTYWVLYYILTDLTMGPPFPLARLVNLVDVFQFSKHWRAGILAALPFAMLTGFGFDAVLRCPMKSRFRMGLRTLAILIAAAVLIYRQLLWLLNEPLFEVSLMVTAIPCAALLCISLATWTIRVRFLRWAIPLLLFAELFTWNHYYLAASFVKPQFKVPERVGATVGQDNRRETDTWPNTRMYTLEPMTTGYDPLFVSRTRLVLCADRKEKYYQSSVKQKDVLRENSRGNLFLKRPFWLARQYVVGPLPDKSALFPPTTTVFLPEHTEDSALMIHENEIYPHGVSRDAVKTTLLETADVKMSRQKGGDNRGKLVLPTIKLNGRHSALYIPYEATGRIDVEIQFLDKTTRRREVGRHHLIKHRRKETGVLEFALPDRTEVTATVSYTAAEPEDTFQVKGAYILQDELDEDRHIQILSRRANSVDVRLSDLTEERILLFTDTDFPGWQATINGKPTPIFLANDAFKAIEVPAGDHDIHFEFKPKSVYAGCFTSLAAVFGCVLALRLLVVKRRA
jgi:hypothetical protein